MTGSEDLPRDDGWEAHRRAELEGSLTATPAQRLQWLEEAIAFAVRAGVLPRDGDALEDEREERP